MFCCGLHSSKILHLMSCTYTKLSRGILVNHRQLLASFPGLQSPNAVEGPVKLLHRMTSGRRWVYIRVDVGWKSAGVALPVKCSPWLDNYCQSRRSIRDRRSTTEQSVVTFRISRSCLTDAVKTSETCGFVAIASWLYATST